MLSIKKVAMTIVFGSVVTVGFESTVFACAMADSEGAKPPLPALHLAILEQKGDEVRRLLDDKADVNELWDTLSPLGCVITVGNENILALLLEAQADVNVPCESGDSALHQAVRCVGTRHSTSFIGRLLDAKADVNVLDTTEQFTPLLQALCFDGSIDTVRLLLENGADPDMKLGKMSMSPLEKAKAMALFRDDAFDWVAIHQLLASYSRSTQLEQEENENKISARKRVLGVIGNALRSVYDAVMGE